jgi:hypothetical protein
MATARTFGMRRSWTALLAVALLTIAQQQAAASKDILVLYLYSSADSQYRTNLNYFVKEAMEKDTRSEYYVLVPKKVKQVPTSSTVSCTVRWCLCAHHHAAQLRDDARQR